MRLLARHVVATTYDDLPEDALVATKQHVMHTVGLILAGSAAPGCAEVYQLVTRWGGAAESTLIGFPGKIPAANAALLHATMAHAWDFDTNDDRINYKASTAPVPAALAAAERVGGTSGKDLLTSACVAIDLGIRLGLATNPKPSHTLVPMVGPFAAAAAAGKLARLDEEALLDAMSLAYCGVSTTGLSIIWPALTKRLLAGTAARAGVFAAELAELGYHGARNILQGADGYYEKMRGVPGDLPLLLDGLGERYEQVFVGPKAYPSCRNTHAPIDAALTLVTQRGIRKEEIEGGTITVCQRDFEMLCGGGDETALNIRRHPKGAVDAQFSIPYAVACALGRSKVFIDDFVPAALEEPEVNRLCDQLAVAGNPEFDDWPLEAKPAMVEVRLRDGRTLSERVDYPKGSPENPVTAERTRDTFRALAGLSRDPLPRDRIEASIDRIDHLEQANNVSELIDLLSPAASG
jgi:2-methylcitrate dehydratase PrpD